MKKNMNFKNCLAYPLSETSSMSGFWAKNDKSDSGFTLAEVLITLTIIGVIAALTIPNLIAKYEKQQYVAKLKKTYSTLHNATKMIITENGSPKCDGGGWACTVDDVYNLYKQQLKIAKDCGADSGCLTQMKTHGFYYFNNEYDGTNWNTDSRGRKVILDDGTQILFHGIAMSSTCDTETDGSADVCAMIDFDVNGEKGPNKFGRDVFSVVIKANGLYPRGCDYKGWGREAEEYASEDEELTEWCGQDTSGTGCACKVIKEGDMNY